MVGPSTSFLSLLLVTLLLSADVAVVGASSPMQHGWLYSNTITDSSVLSASVTHSRNDPININTMPTRSGRHRQMRRQQQQQQKSTAAPSTATKKLVDKIPRGGAAASASFTPPKIIEDPGSKTIEDILLEWFSISKFSHPVLEQERNVSQLQAVAKKDLFLQTGLTSDLASELLMMYGKNEIEELPPPSYFELIREQFEDRLVRILVGVAVLSAILEYTSGSGSASASMESIWHRFAEPVVISSLLIVNAAVGVWQSKSAGNSIEALKAMQPSVCTVIRDDGQEMADYPATDLVPGDLIVLKTGDKIPADARVVSYYNGRRSLSVDETCLTGESVAVEKLVAEEGLAPMPNSPVQNQPGMVFGGTTVVSGAAVALVVATGSNTEFGRIQSGVLQAKRDSHDQKTPLAKQLDEFGNQLTVLIGIICAMVWIASIPKMFAKNSNVFSSPLEGMVYYAKVAVALGVAAIPEGLPAVITLCLSLGTRRMAQRNVIVRNLPSVETLGCVSVICSDKTGTLTTNEMTVTSLVLLEQQHRNKNKNGKTTKTKNISPIVEHSVEGVSYSPFGKIEGIKGDDGDIDAKSSISDVAAVAALCNDARIIGNDDVASVTATANANANQREFERTGEPTEAALCVLAEKLGVLKQDNENNNDNDINAKVRKSSALASYHVNHWRERYPRTATLEFHRDRKSKCYNVLMLLIDCIVLFGSIPRTYCTICNPPPFACINLSIELS